MRISDWSSDVCSSDLVAAGETVKAAAVAAAFFAAGDQLLLDVVERVGAPKRIGLRGDRGLDLAGDVPDRFERVDSRVRAGCKPVAALLVVAPVGPQVPSGRRVGLDRTVRAELFCDPQAPRRTQ